MPNLLYLRLGQPTINGTTSSALIDRALGRAVRTPLDASHCVVTEQAASEGRGVGEAGAVDTMTVRERAAAAAANASVKDAFLETLAGALWWNESMEVKAIALIDLTHPPLAGPVR